MIWSREKKDHALESERTLRDRIEALESELIRFRSTPLEALHSKLSELEKALQDSKGENAELAQQLDKEQRVRRTATALRDGLRVELDEAKEELLRLRGHKKTTYEVDIDGLRIRADSSEKLMKMALRQRDEAQAEVKELKRKLRQVIE